MAKALACALKTARGDGSVEGLHDRRLHLLEHFLANARAPAVVGMRRNGDAAVLMDRLFDLDGRHADHRRQGGADA